MKILTDEQVEFLVQNPEVSDYLEAVLKILREEHFSLEYIKKTYTK